MDGVPAGSASQIEPEVNSPTLEDLGQFFLEVSYHGAAYNGWQSQHNAVGVQQVLEEVLGHVLRHPVASIACGRTDTGVHALQQWVQISSYLPLATNPHWLMRMNRALPMGIAIKSIKQVAATAHARFSCVARSYVYRIHRIKDPFLQGLSYYYPFPLSIEKMEAACPIFLQHTDFQSLSKVHTSVKTFLCTITECRWQVEGSQLQFHITANRFLHGMVRTVVGIMLDVGKGKLSLTDVEAILQAKDRRQASRSVPPEGLYLRQGHYPGWVWGE